MLVGLHVLYARAEIMVFRGRDCDLADIGARLALGWRSAGALRFILALLLPY